MYEKRFGALILFYSLLFSLAFAQSANDFNSLIGGLVSVVFIVIFVIILLILGGVIKKPTGGGIPGFLIMFIVLVILLFVIPMFVPYPQYLEVPANFKIIPLPSYAAQIFMMLGLPEEWMYVPAIIYLFILPFAAIYTLVWAFLQSLLIFTNVPSSVNRVLAFIVAFLTIPFGWFVKIVWVLFSFMGAWSVVIFVATFVIGVFFRGYGKVEEERYALMGKKWRSEARRRLNNALNDINNKQAGGAINEINAALNFSGFHPDYYKQLDNAKNLLNQQQPDWKGAEDAIKKALQYI